MRSLRGHQWRPVGSICGRRYGLCAGCGVVRLVDRVAESALGLLYAHYYNPEELSREALEHQLKNPTFAYRLRRIESMRGSRERRIFEIGCGDGNFLAFMQRAGWTVDGSEFGSESVSLVRDRHGIAITEGDVTKQRPQSAPYPVVAAYHVIEHIYRPAEWLRQVRTLIEPRGLLCLQTPNWSSLTHAPDRPRVGVHDVPAARLPLYSDDPERSPSALRLRRALGRPRGIRGTARARRVAHSAVARSNSRPAGCRGARRSALTGAAADRTSTRARRFAREACRRRCCRSPATLWRASSRWLDGVGSSI